MHLNYFSCIVQMKIVSVPGDGNCLFHAIGYSTGIPHDKLRRQCAQFIRENHSVFDDDEVLLADWIEWETDMSSNEYADWIQQTGHWGGALEMLCVMKFLDISIAVYVKEHGVLKNIVTFTPTGGGQKSIRIYYNGNSHFSAIA